jgi:hypothetical protein
MPISYDRLDDERMVVVTLDGTFESDDIVEVMRRVDADSLWSYGMLWNLRHMSGSPTTDQLWFFSRAYVHAADGPPKTRGPVAVVTVDDEMYRRGCLYVAMTRPQLDIDVFRDLDEARTWLSARIAASSPA